MALQVPCSKTQKEGMRAVNETWDSHNPLPHLCNTSVSTAAIYPTVVLPYSFTTSFERLIIPATPEAAINITMCFGPS